MILNYLTILFILCNTSCSANEEAANANLMKVIKIIVSDVYIRHSVYINLIFLSENSWNDSILSPNEVFKYLNTELIPRYTSLDRDDRQKASDAIIMTDSLEYTLSILKNQLTVTTTRWFYIALSHCSIEALDGRSASFIELICCYNKSLPMICMTSNKHINYVSEASKTINKKFLELDMNSSNLFAAKIRRNCKITALVAIRPPFAYYDDFQNLIGIDVKILHEITSSLNLNLQLSITNSSNFTSNKFDIHVGYYTETIKLKISKPFNFHEFIYVVPSYKRVSSLEKLFQAFDEKIWFLISLIILMAFMSTYAMNTQSLIIRKFIFGRNSQLKFMNVLGGLLGTSSHQFVSKRNFIRILWIAFLIFGLLMRTLHQATLFKLLQNDDIQKEVQTLDEGIKKGLTVYSDVMYKNFINESMNLSIKYINQHKMHTIITKAFNNEFQGIIFLPSAQINFFSRNSSQFEHFKIIEHSRIVIPSVFHFSKQFYFAKEVDEKIGIFQAAGLIKFWTDLEIHQIYKVNEILEPKKLTLSHVSILFNILIAGHFVSIVAFGLELIYASFVERKKKVFDRLTVKSIRS